MTYFGRFRIEWILAVLIAIPAAVVAAETVEGTLKKVGSRPNVLTVEVEKKDDQGKDVKKELEVRLSKKSSIKREGKTATIEDLKPGDRIKLKYEERTSKKDATRKFLQASEVEVLTQPSI